MIHIDWLTLVREGRGTHHPTFSDEAAGGLGGSARIAISGWRAIAAEGQPGRHMWYHGCWYSSANGSAFAGVGNTNGKEQEILLISGHLAEQWAPYAIDQGGWRATRLDLQVTVKEHVNVPELIAAHRAAFSRIKSSDINGQTMYVGSRTSERFWRIYDKAEQMRKPELSPLWRWEVELKGKRAELAWLLISEENSQETRHRIMYHNRIGIVKEHFPVQIKGGELLPKLPRTRGTEEEFARKTVIPFLRGKPQIRAIIREAMDNMEQE